VRLIKLDEGDRLVAMAKVDADEAVETAPAEGGEAPPAPEGVASDTDTAPADGKAAETDGTDSQTDSESGE
jgi:hypothetical protein